MGPVHRLSALINPWVMSESGPSALASIRRQREAESTPTGSLARAEVRGSRVGAHQHAIMIVAMFVAFVAALVLRFRCTGAVAK